MGGLVDLMQRNMHRTGKLADWELTDSTKWNKYQKVADRTNGIITPANLISLAGLALTIRGARNIAKKNDVKALTQIGLGRALDIADGFVADKTGTKSPLGEAVDATFDKLAVASCLPALYKRQIINREFAGALAIQNITNSVFTVVAKLRIQEIHPDKSGKDSAFKSWVAVGTHYLANIADDYDCFESSVVLQGAGKYLEESFVETGVEATAKYAVAALGKKEEV